MAKDENIQASRFTVVVPEPESRFNMGKPDKENQFGYPGISLKTAKHFLLEVEKTAITQTGNTYTQTEGAWDQFADGNMTLASGKEGRFAVDGKLMLVSGAGQGWSPAFTWENKDPRWIDFNNLGLHTLVDGIHNTLKALCYGSTWDTLQATSALSQKTWINDYGTLPADSLLKTLRTVLIDVLGAVPSQDVAKLALKGLEWKGDNHAAAPTHLPPWKRTSEYGPLQKLDPYAPTGFKGTPRMIFAVLMQTGVFLRRFSDVLEQILPAISDNEIFRRIKNLVTVAKDFDGLLAKLDPAKWERYSNEAREQTKKKWDEDAVENPKKVPGAGDQPAKLESQDGPFDVSDVSDMQLKVRDVEKGTQTIVDFSDLRGSAATLTVTVDGKFSSIAAANAGTLTLDGQTATYANNAWTLPSGFTHDTASGLIGKGGALFTAVAGTGGSFSDRTFHGKKVEFVVDGTKFVISLQTLNALSADNRATALAALLTGKGGCTATASGAAVTIKGKKRGSDGELKLENTTAAAGLGLAGVANGSGEGEISAADVKARLDAAGANFDVAVSGDKLTITHRVSGKTSYIEMNGPLAAVFFENDPAVAKGKGGWDNINDAATWLKSIEDWFSLAPIQDSARIAYQAVADVVGVWSQIEKVLKDLDAFIAPNTGYQAVGLVAGKGGITMAAEGNVFSTSHSITMVAAGDTADPDKSKFIPLFEHILLGVDKLNEAINDKLTEWREGAKTQQEKDAAAIGHVRVAAQGTINLMSLQSTHVIGESIKLYGNAVEAVGKDRTAVASRLGALDLRGKTVTVGGLTDAAPQLATTSIALEATESFRVLAKSQGVWIDETDKVIQLGAVKAASAPPAIDVEKANVIVDATKNHIRLGVVNGGKRYGMVAEGTGDVELSAKAKLTINAADNKKIEIDSSGVSISGKLDVGAGALTVQGAPMPAVPKIELAIAAIPAAVEGLKAQYQLLVAAAKQLKTGIEAMGVQMQATQDLIDTIPGGVSVAAARALITARNTLRTQGEARNGLVQQLQKLKTKWDDLLGQARALSVDEITSKEQEDAAVFVVPT